MLECASQEDNQIKGESEWFINCFFLEFVHIGSVEVKILQ